MARKGIIKIENDDVYIAPEILYNICNQIECIDIYYVIKKGVEANCSCDYQLYQTLIEANEEMFGILHENENEKISQTRHVANDQIKSCLSTKAGMAALNKKDFIQSLFPIFRFLVV